jgi:cellulose biosynthesis protein BcsQ
MTINALVVATEVIVPVDMSVFSVRGMVKLMGTMQEVRKVNPALPPPRIVACRTEKHDRQPVDRGRAPEKIRGERLQGRNPQGERHPRGPRGAAAPALPRPEE